MDILEELNALGADTETGLSHFRGNKDLYERLVRKFPATAVGLEVRPFLDSGEYEKAFMNAHSMKGVCGNLFLTSLLEKYSELTEALRDEKDIELAKSMIDSVDELQAKFIGVLGA